MTDYDCNPDRFDSEKQPIEWTAAFIVHAWETKCPDKLDENSRFLLFHFIVDAFSAEGHTKH